MTRVRTHKPKSRRRAPLRRRGWIQSLVQTLGLGLVVALAVLAPASAARADLPDYLSNWAFSGYVKSFVVQQGSADIEGLPAGTPDQVTEWQNALRLMASGPLSDTARFEIHYEVKPHLYSSATTGLSDLTATASPANSSYRYRDLNNEVPSRDGEQVLLQNLDRLNLRLDLGGADLIIGRQAVAFGSARFISPNDIFEPYLVSTLDTEYRVGVDALRLTGALGDFSEYDLGLVIGRDGQHEASALYGRLKTSLGSNDIEGVAILRDDFSQVGLGIERPLGDLGFWAEAAYTDVRRGSDYIRVSTGLDKAFGDTVLGMVEYHFSSAGSSDPADFTGLLGKTPFRTGGVTLLGEHYLIPSLSWTATPLLVLDASGFFNLGDGSGFIKAGGVYSLSDNLYTDFGIYAGFGEETRLTWTPPSPVPALDIGSEFGAFPPTVYASLRYYF